jgi:hypothetical protein
MWFLAAIVVATCALAVLAAVARLGREIPRVLEAFDDFGRELSPALIRVRSATEHLQARTPQP